MKSLLVLFLIFSNIHLLFATDELCTPTVKNIFARTYDSLATLVSGAVKEDKIIESEHYLSEVLPGGRRRLTLKPGKEHVPFEGAGMFNLASYNPEYVKKLGITLKVENGKTFVEYPSASELNKIIRALQKAKDPLAPQFTIKLIKTEGEIPMIDFIDSLARGELPITYRGKHYFHDLGVHMVGWLYLPKEVTDALSVRLKLLSDMYKHPGLSRLKTRIKLMIEDEIKTIDTHSAILNERIGASKVSKYSREDSFDFNVYNIGHGINRITLRDLRESFTLNFTPEELKIIESIHPGNVVNGPTYESVQAILAQRPLP